MPTTTKRIQKFGDIIPGEICYWFDEESKVWYVYFPACGAGSLRNHAVTEHDDLTITVTHAREYLDEVSKRFRSVHVENLDFQKCIRMYDGPSTFFYLDPPYRGTHGGDNHYNCLSDQEWTEMRDALKNCQGKFLLSHTDDKFVLRLFKKNHVMPINVRVTLARTKGIKARKEVLISNYPLPSFRRQAKYITDRKALKKDASQISATSRPTVHERQSQQIIHRKAMRSLAQRRSREKILS